MVVTDWYQPPYAKTYKSGVFKKDSRDDFQSLAGDLVPNHASVLTGWGVLKNPKSGEEEKYWVLRNSFGEDFGDKGHILVERGSNSFQVESSIASFEPELY